MRPPVSRLAERRRARRAGGTPASASCPRSRSTIRTRPGVEVAVDGPAPCPPPTRSRPTRSGAPLRGRRSSRSRRRLAAPPRQSVERGDDRLAERRLPGLVRVDDEEELSSPATRGRRRERLRSRRSGSARSSRRPPRPAAGRARPARASRPEAERELGDAAGCLVRRGSRAGALRSESEASLGRSEVRRPSAAGAGGDVRSRTTRCADAPGEGSSAAAGRAPNGWAPRSVSADDVRPAAIPSRREERRPPLDGAPARRGPRRRASRS